MAWVSHTRTKETGQYLTPEEAWSSSQVPQDEPHGQWVWEAGLGLGTRTRPQPHGGSKKGQEQRRQRLSSQGPTPPAPAACPPGMLPGAGLQDAPTVVPDSGCGRGRLLNKGQSPSV